LKRVEWKRKKEEKNLQKVLQKRDEYLPLLPRRKLLERATEKAERVETKGF